MELENEIHFMGRPLGQALLSFSNSRSGELARFCREVSQMHTRENITIESAWNNCLALFRDQWSLVREEWDLFRSIGEVLGKSDRASQCSFIQMMREKFTIQEKKAEEDRVRKDKLYKNLGTMGGLALVLILI